MVSVQVKSAQSVQRRPNPLFFPTLFETVVKTTNSERPVQTRVLTFQC